MKNTAEKEYKVRTPLFPLYDAAIALMRVVHGTKKAHVSHLIRAIHDQTGTPKKPVDWSEPAKWIEERLKGQDAVLARRIWDDTAHLVNPRYINGSYLFINGHNLLVAGDRGLYQTTPKGKKFLTGDKQTVMEIDKVEGLMQLLSILSTKGQAKRGDILPEWSEYLNEFSKFRTSSTHKETLRRRLANLIERKLVDRRGNTYAISDTGLQYLETIGPIPVDLKHKVLKAAQHFNDDQRTSLKVMLGNMHPYKFEHLIRDLLEAMGYEDVIVTKEAGDKGVDVIGNIQFGITSVREVVQVKRTPKSSIGRPILDQLRGALPYHQAIRGTIITLGAISKGAREAAVFPGAAPITLIDGEKLVDLMVEHDVGMKKRPVMLWELDQIFFEASDEADIAEVE